MPWFFKLDDLRCPRGMLKEAASGFVWVQAAYCMLYNVSSKKFGFVVHILNKCTSGLVVKGTATSFRVL